MDIFFTLFVNLSPLYLLIALGFIAGRYLDVNLHSIARINLFILLPIVSFGAVLKMEFQPAYLLLPVLLYGLSWVNILTTFHISQRLTTRHNALLLGAGGANGNAVYFGLPLIFYLFSPELFGVYLFMNLGPQINNITTAYFLTARGGFSWRDSLVRVVRFPVVHAIWIALVLNALGFGLGNGIALTYWEYASGAIVFLGMMMVGIALGKQKEMAFDWMLTAGFFASKFLLWPMMIIVFVILDQWVFGLFSRDIHLLLGVWSAMPLMGNLVAYAAEYKLHPEKAAAAVLSSALFVIVFIPFMYFVMNHFVLS